MASARELLQAAERQQEIRSKWETQIREAEQIEVPTEEFVAKAKAEVDAANQAVVDGLAVRNAKSALEMADKYLQESKDLQSKARKLRGAAHDTQDVLTEAIAKIPNCPLKVLIDDDGDARLVIKTDRSEQEPFDELSDGQRWNAILPLCFQNNRLIVLSQAAFGEIQPKNVKLLDELARTHGAYILTAQVDDGQLRGESWSSNGKAVS